MVRKRVVFVVLALLVVVLGTSAAVFGLEVGSSDSSANDARASDVRAGFEAQRLRGTVAPTTTEAPTTTTEPPPVDPPPPPPPPPPAPIPSPAAAPAPPPPPPPAPACGGGQGATIDAMNADRAANGLAPLCGNGQLAAAAQQWANWMAQNASLTHQDLNALIGRTPFHTVGENILVAPVGTSASAWEGAWMGSPGHRANILSGAFTSAGAGSAVSGDGRVWVCVDFGG
jgi:uncharacterized protein YkwD